MAGYRKTNKREALLVGRVSDMLRKGRTPEEIAEVLDQPLERVKSLIELIERADKSRKSVNG